MTHKEKIVKHYKFKMRLAKKYLAALRTLLVQYEENDLMADCPLCLVGENACNNCPWQVLLDRPCINKEEVMKEGHIACYNRKVQIRHWIKAYEAAVKELFKEEKED